MLGKVALDRQQLLYLWRVTAPSEVSRPDDPGVPSKDLRRKIGGAWLEAQKAERASLTLEEGEAWILAERVDPNAVMGNRMDLGLSITLLLVGVVLDYDAAREIGDVPDAENGRDMTMQEAKDADLERQRQPHEDEAGHYAED